MRRPSSLVVALGAALAALAGACSPPELTFVHYEEHRLSSSRSNWSADQTAPTPAIRLALRPPSGPGVTLTLNPDGEARLAGALQAVADGWDPPYDAGDGFDWYTWDLLGAGGAPVHVSIDWLPGEFQPLVTFLGELQIDAPTCDPRYLAACAPS